MTGELERNGGEVQRGVETIGDDAVDPGIAEAFTESVREGAKSMDIEHFMEVSNQGVHQHAPDKGEGTHDLRGAWNVSEDLIDQYLAPHGIVPNGHEAVHALLAGRDKFIAADAPVFSDTHDTDPRRWEKVRKTAEQAPIPPGRQSVLDTLFA